MSDFDSIVSKIIAANSLGVSECPYCGATFAEKQHPLGHIIRVRALCRHEEAARDRRDEVEARSAAYTRWRSFNGSMLPPLPSSVDLDELEDTPAIAQGKRKAWQYLNGITGHIKNGHGLYLHGDTGTGKTSLACAIAKELDRQRFTVCALTSGQLIDGYKGRDADQFRDMIQAVSILVIDDLGSEAVTDYATAKLFEAINDRYASKRPTIITSNFSPKGLADRYTRMLSAKGGAPEDVVISTKRLFSRLAELCEIVEFVGDDYRLRRRGWSLLSGGGAS